MIGTSMKTDFFLPTWDVPAHNQLIELMESEGWCLMNMSGGWHPQGNGYIKGMKLTFRK